MIAYLSGAVANLGVLITFAASAIPFVRGAATQVAAGRSIEISYSTLAPEDYARGRKLLAT
jgi:hypothetical protein